MRGLIAALALWLGLAAAVLAHSTPSSTVHLDVAEAGVTAKVLIPMDELKAAWGRPVAIASVRHERPAFEAYLREHVKLKATDGRPWTLSIEDMKGAREVDHAVLLADLAFTPPPGAEPRRFILEYDAVTHEVMSHYALVYARNLYPTSPPGSYEAIGRIQSPVTSLVFGGGPVPPPPVEVKPPAPADRPDSQWRAMLPLIILVGLVVAARLLMTRRRRT